MVIAVILGLVVTTIAFAGWVLWQLKKAVGRLMAAYETTPSMPPQYEALNSQVRELRQAMGGVLKTIHVMGNQMQHLNVMAGNAMQGDPAGRPQMMIEYHANGEAEGHMITPEDMPPEMMEKFRAFQNIYMAIMENPDRPSSNQPELN